MVEFKFFGRVIPENRGVTIRHNGSITWRINSSLWADPARPETITIQFWLENCELQALCFVPRFNQDILNDAAARGLIAIRNFVNLWSFQRGSPVFVLFDQVEDPNGARRDLINTDARLAPLLTSLTDSDYGTLAFNWELSLAINDAMMAIGIPRYTPIGCGRAIESVRAAFTPADAKPKAGWAGMQNALNLSESYVKRVTDASAKSRHAEPETFSAAEIEEIIKRTWKVIDRYIEYLKCGASEPLSVEDFPLL